MKIIGTIIGAIILICIMMSFKEKTNMQASPISHGPGFVVYSVGEGVFVVKSTDAYPVSITR
jgi:hypothetical protein